MYYTYDRLLYDDLKLELKYRGLYTSRTAGFSHNGRRIMVCQVGRGKRRALYVGAHHGRESVSSAFLVRVMENLLADAKRQFYGAVRLLNEYTLDFVPMLNPDGVSIALGGYEGEPNCAFLATIGGDHWLWKANARGVDLNRNYDAGWAALPSPDGPASQGYKGEAPASEAETQVVTTLCNAHAYEYAVTVHARGEQILYADCLSEPAGSAQLAEGLSAICGFEVCPPADGPDSLGGFENWFRLRTGRPALLIELAPGDAPFPIETGRLLGQSEYVSLVNMPYYLRPKEDLT